MYAYMQIYIYMYIKYQGCAQTQTAPGLRPFEAAPSWS